MYPEETQQQSQQQPVAQPSAGKQAVPDKFIDPGTGDINTAALLNSYLELERKLSTMMPRPDNDEDRINVLRLLGMPETPEEYQVEIRNGLLEPDPEVNSRLHAKGFTIEQVQEVYDLAAEKLVPAILELAGEFQADREVERLVAAFGGPEKWAEVSRQLLAFGKKNLPPAALANLASSFEGVMALYRMMKGQEPGLSSNIAEGAEPMNELDLQAMMRDPRYYRERDPAYIAKVTEGFKRMYNE